MSPRKGDMEPDFSHTLLDGRAGFPALMDALEAHLLQAGVPMAVASSVMIAADEVVANVLDYSDAGSVAVTAQVREGRVAVQVVDDGAAFDPIAAVAPDTSQSVEARGIGGLGIHLVRKLMDEIGYERAGGANRLRFSKSYDAVSPSRRSGGEAS